LKKLILSLITLVVILTTFLTRPALAVDIDHGKQLFGANCAACHIGGKNVVNPAKTLALTDLEKYGMNTQETIIGQITKGKNAMPAFGGRLKPADIEDVASFVLAQAEKGW
jgi:cytochrome c6